MISTTRNTVKSSTTLAVFAGHPFPNVGRTTLDPDALHLTAQKELHDLLIHEAHFVQVEHQVVPLFRLN